MALYALDDLDDALDVTRSFLTPVKWATWAKLALVAIFVGGPGASFFPTGGGGGGAGPSGDPSGIDLGPEVWLVIVALVGVLVLVVLLFALIGSILEFVFVESLRSEAVTIRRYWRRRWPQGLRLFGFRLVLGLFVLAGVAVLVAPFVLSMLDVGPFGGGLSIAAFLMFLPLFVVFAIVAGIVQLFTTAFVVPIMILEDTGVLAGWRRLWPTIVREWKQYLAYAVAGFLLSAVGGVFVGIVTAIGALVLLIPFGLLFVVGFALFAFVAQPLGILVFVVFGLLYVLSIVAIFALAQVPVKTYLRYYALLVLGDVEPELDVIPDQRAATRSESAGETA